MAELPAYDESATVGQARELYFAANDLGESGYSDRWVRLRLAGRTIIMFPNSAARVRSIRLHDIHHVVAGYDTSWTGEAEVAAWEIGGGCADHGAAWLLNMSALAIGAVIAPVRTLAAFARGRRSRTLYSGEFVPALLAESLGALRRRLELPSKGSSPAATDLALFGLWVPVSMAALVGSYALLLWPLVVLLG